MTMNDNEIEQKIQDKGKTAARVTPDAIKENIASEHYFTAGEGVAGHCFRKAKTLHSPRELELLTFCVLRLKNGFTVTGESACASPDNFDPEIGRDIARANAIQKVWPLLGFRLRDELARQEAAPAAPVSHQQRVLDEKTELADRLAKLDAFILDNPVFLTLPEAEQARMKRQAVAMATYCDVLGDCIQHFC